MITLVRDLRWRKLLRETWLHKARTLLVAVAFAIGLAASGALLDTHALIQRVTRDTFAASNPVSATLRVDRVDPALLAQVRALPQIGAVRARRVVSATVQSGAATRSALIYAFDDFTRTSIAAVKSETGPWPPPDGELAIERSALAFSGARLGEAVRIMIGRAEPRTATVSGIVRDVGLAPGWMDNVVYLYATARTLQRLGAPAGFDEVQLRVRDATADRAAVRRIAAAAKGIIERAGGHVGDVDVPVPGDHPHAAQMNSLMMTQFAFGALTLLVCAFLVVNLVNAMLARQVREIGIMKTLGGGNAAIGAIYLGHALLIGVVASALALPVAMALGRAYAGFKSEMLNFPLDGIALPAGTVALQFVAGCLLPVVAAAWPVWRGCRMPVAAALRDVGIAGDVSARRIGALPGIGRPLLLSLNNALRRRGRLLLTLGALAAGGAVYVGAANLRLAVIASVDDLFAAMRFDFALRLGGDLAPDRLESLATGVPGIAAAEAWTSVAAARVGEAGSEGNLRLVGVPARGRLLAPNLGAGRWVGAGDAREAVVSLGAVRDDPSLAVGSTLTVRIDGVAYAWTIVGQVATGLERAAYVSRDALARIRADAGANVLVVALREHGAGAQLETARELRAALDAAGASVASSQRIAETRRSVEDHLLMVIQFLAGMGWVMILVGGVGLASTMGLSVLERTREIGVLRAIGAGRGAIMRLVAGESLAIGALSWLAALPLSLPVSVLIGDAFGRMMFPVATRLLPDPAATLRWLLLVVAIALLASAWPARRAMRVPVAGALAYE